MKRKNAATIQVLILTCQVYATSCGFFHHSQICVRSIRKLVIAQHARSRQGEVAQYPGPAHVLSQAITPLVQKPYFQEFAIVVV